MIIKKTHPIVIIFGPTGVGKSELAEGLADILPSEIINMDVGQMYTPFTIGTAKPDWQNSSIPHHLFDCIDEPDNYTVTRYRSDLIEKASDSIRRNKVPLVVGGSAFYLKSLLFPPQAPAGHQKMVGYVEDSEALWNELYVIDPIRANALHKKDTYRIQRALSIWKATGKKPSDYSIPYDPPFRFLLVYVTRNRQELYTRINDRVRIMMQQGWLEEVQALRGTPWATFLYKKKIIGYNEILDYLAQQEHDQNSEQLIATIAQRTRHYAKRQNTFWNMLNRMVEKALIVHPSSGALELINLTSLNVDLYIKQLSKKVLEFSDLSQDF